MESRVQIARFPGRVASPIVRQRKGAGFDVEVCSLDRVMRHDGRDVDRDDATFASVVDAVDIARRRSTSRLRIERSACSDCPSRDELGPAWPSLSAGKVPSAVSPLSLRLTTADR